MTDSASPRDGSDDQRTLDALTASLGGPGELLALLRDYRQLVAALAEAPHANSVLPNMRCFWSRKQKCRMAIDLPEHARALFLR